MQKPHETKQIALYALICSCICIVMQVSASLLPQQFGFLYASGWTVTLSMQTKLVLIAGVLLGRLPLAALALWNYLGKQATRTAALLTVILAPVLSTVCGLLGSGISMLYMRFVGNEEIAGMSVANSAAGMFGILHTASLVLLCCGGAIELYALKKMPPDNQN